MTSLFRKEAIAHASRKLEGEVILASPLPVRAVALAAVLIVGALAVFIGTASYARKETVPGRLVPVGGLIRVTSRLGGVIDRFDVEEGQKVSAATILATIKAPAYFGVGREATNETQKILAAQEQAQSIESAIAVELLSSEGAQLKTRQRFIRLQVSEAERGISLQHQRIALAEREADRGRVLAQQGLMASRELDNRQATLIAARQTLSSLNAGLLALKREASDVEARSRDIGNEIAGARVRANLASAGLEQRIIEAEVASKHNAVAPVAGQVLALAGQVGKTLAPGATVAVLAPTGSPLEAELFVPTRTVGFIKAGQDVQLMYQAFPHQKFGVGKGKILSISEAPLAPSEIDEPSLPVSEAAYRVRVQIGQQTVGAYNAQMPLRPGMLLNASIILEKRNLLQWLLDPLYAARSGHAR